MENGKTEDKEMEEASLELAQLRALVAELRSGLQGALQEVCVLQERDCSLEEKLQAHQSDVDDRIMGLRNSLNTFKEDLSGALDQVKEVSSRQRDMQKNLDTLQSHDSKDILEVQQRKSCRAEDGVPAEGEEPVCLAGQTELNVIQHYFNSLPTSSPHRSAASTQTSNSGEQESGGGQPQRGGAKSPVWRERKDSRDETEAQSVAPENSKRQVAALELLESERVYVSYLSLLLKANISFNGSEVLHAKDKRPFPSSLRFLIQQHLELLHTLQERVLKRQWQGIMGDVFMRLTSKESDFLDFYVSYLKELPECLSVVSMLTSSHMKTASLLEGDIMGDETRPSLHTLLLQPVQRIPEYLMLLQTLLKQTESEHPDYYLLLVCIQQFRSFTTQYAQLLQHNEELLLHNRKELKRSTMKQFFRNMDCGIQANELGSPFPTSNAILEHANQVKRSKQRLLEQIQSRRYQDWERDRERESEPHVRYDQDHRPSPVPFYTPPDLPDPRLKPAGLHSIPESEPERAMLVLSAGSSSTERLVHQRLPLPGSALADALGEFLLPGEAPGLEGLYEDCSGGGGEHASLHNASLYEHCSDHSSSDSSIDIAFVRCPKSHQAAPAGMGSREAFVERRSQGSGYSKLPGRVCVSPDEAALMRHHHRPLQAGQRKSKSLNGLQLDSVVGGGERGDGSDHFRGHQHAKLERQGSKGCPTPTRRGQASLGGQHRAEPERQAAAPEEELHNEHNKESANPSWGEEPRWRAGPDESNHTPFSERSRKQDKGGFRSSFKKLFKKKSGGEGKEKCNEKTENSSDLESGKTPRVHLDIDRGTAV